MQVYVALRDAIVRGRLAPGQRLSENALAAEMGVSRTPIREGLSLLREDRLVETVPQLGSFVARVDPAAIADAQFVREALECAAIRLAAQAAGEADIAELEENLPGQERALEQGDQDAFYLLDNAFHRSLCDLSGHPAVWTVSERAKVHLNRVRRLSLGMPGLPGGDDRRAPAGDRRRRRPRPRPGGVAPARAPADGPARGAAHARGAPRVLRAPGSAPEAPPRQAASASRRTCSRRAASISVRTWGP